MHFAVTLKSSTHH